MRGGWGSPARSRWGKCSAVATACVAACAFYVTLKLLCPDGCRRRQAETSLAGVTFTGAELPEEEPLGEADTDTEADVAIDKTWSSFEVRAPDFGPQRSDVAMHTYHILHNVRWEKGRVRYALSPNDDPADVPEALPRSWNKGAARINVSVIVQEAEAEGSPLRRCSAWVEEPAVMFHMPNHENLLHFLNDGFLLVWQTLLETGLMPSGVARVLDSAQRRDSAVEDCLLPDTQGGELLLLPDNPRPLEFRWAFLFDLLTSEHRPPEEATGQCFRKLIVGTSYVMDFRLAIPGQAEGLRQFQRYALRAALTQRIKQMPDSLAETRSKYTMAECEFLATSDAELTPGLWRSGGSQPRVVYAARPPPAGRAVMNEDEIAAAIRERYDVELVVTTFDGSDHYEAMRAMQSTDVLIGMHGASMAHSIFLPPGATVLQMFPYGWTWLDIKTPCREEMTRNLVLAANCTYARWVNKRPENAYLRKEDFEADGISEQWREHPWDKAQINPAVWQNTSYWLNQGTLVDMADFLPVLEAVLDGAGMPRRNNGTVHISALQGRNSSLQATE